MALVTVLQLPLYSEITRLLAKGENTRSFFPNTGERKSKRLQMGINLATVVTGHGPLRSYYHRFKIKDDPECVCRMGPQTTNHLRGLEF